MLCMQLLQAKRQARQQAFFNLVTLCLAFGSLAGVSTWEPHFRYLGRIWQVVPVGNKVQAYTELASEGFAWALLLTMGWPWNLLIYPVHLTRKELTSARKAHRSAIDVMVLVKNNLLLQAKSKWVHHGGRTSFLRLSEQCSWSLNSALHASQQCRASLAVVKQLIVPQQDFDSAGAQSCRISRTAFTTHLQGGSSQSVRLCSECRTMLWFSHLSTVLTLADKLLTEKAAVRP